FERLVGGRELFQHRDVESVHLLRAIEPDEQNVAALLEGDTGLAVGVVHRRTILDDRALTPHAERLMCRNIRVLHHFEPPTSPEEIRAAALQFVRKVSGHQKPAVADEAAFARAIDEVTRTTERLLEAL